MTFTNYGLFHYYNASSGHYSAEINSSKFYNISGNGSYSTLFRYRLN
jgi:hypothetical protein